MQQAERFRSEVQAWQGLVYSVAFGILLNAQDALDITQETFIKAFEEPAFLDEGFNRKSWLVRVARNLALNTRRSLMRKLRSLMQVAGLFPQATEDSVEEQIVRAEDRQELKAVLEKLGPEERELVTLRYAAELSYEEIAAELNIKLGTVMSRLARVKAKIGMALEEENNS
ncbi:MAG TPA: RNA polymerase sigma factor [Candidatus Ozemobacteraceae bacterium]|nr:RNA polymerase sigma factor [Candidatus Ozemobacteraceae bacterium]